MIVNRQEIIVEDVGQLEEHSYAGKDACGGHDNGSVRVRKQQFPDHEGQVCCLVS